jgi:hypothetical protein
VIFVDNASDFAVNTNFISVETESTFRCPAPGPRLFKEGANSGCFVGGSCNGECLVAAEEETCPLSTVNAATCEFDISESFGGPDFQVTITLEDVLDGVKITATGTDPSLIGDLRGVFFHVNDFAALAGLTVAGTDVTSFLVAEDAVQKLAKGAVMTGGGKPAHKYDVGVEIGTSGIGKDDIQTTEFIIDSTAGLTIDDFINQEFGIRLTSVGAGPRKSSSKVAGIAVCAL